MFNTKEPPPRKPRLVELAEQDLASAEDNLNRAKAAAGRCYSDAVGRDITSEWGQSGRTLGNIIAGYESWVAEAQSTVAQAKEATRGVAVAGVPNLIMAAVPIAESDKITGAPYRYMFGDPEDVIAEYKQCVAEAEATVHQAKELTR